MGGGVRSPTQDFSKILNYLFNFHKNLAKYFVSKILLFFSWEPVLPQNWKFITVKTATIRRQLRIRSSDFAGHFGCWNRTLKDSRCDFSVISKILDLKELTRKFRNFMLLHKTTATKAKQIKVNSTHLLLHNLKLNQGPEELKKI